ncbi:MAG TPA: PfkB family carbohydrate kinase [Candidatus Lokiarchaeia archaeon]|nr:PfkB family carbohydrate kinase [Candidatus Lokiarchaeia archaeon]
MSAKNYDLFSFGHISLDVINTPDDRKEALGGAILHAAWVAYQLGFNAGILTKSTLADKAKLDEFPPISPEDLYWVKSKATTSIVNDYKDRSLETRVNYSQGQADPYKKKDFPKFSAKIIQYAALMQGEVDLELLKWLASQAPLVTDAAGFIRTVMPDKSMESQPWPDLMEAFPFFSFFKADAAEANYLTSIDTENHEGRVQAAQQFIEWGAKEIILTHNQEVLVATSEGTWDAPFKNRNLSGRTGRGDNATTSYILARLSMPPEEAVRFSAGLTSLKMETPGPFKGTREDVEAYIAEYY